MHDGSFTGFKLDDFISGAKIDYVGARAIINGSDAATEIAGYAEKYRKALDACGFMQPTGGGTLP